LHTAGDRFNRWHTLRRPQDILDKYLARTSKLAASAAAKSRTLRKQNLQNALQNDAAKSQKPFGPRLSPMS
jgi:hypothetical protein